MDVQLYSIVMEVQSLVRQSIVIFKYKIRISEYQKYTEYLQLTFTIS